ncbi:MAG: hypothetical protein ACRD1R_21385, partial [Acidobacteriota bacterium]
MKRKRFTEEQIIWVLKQAKQEPGEPICAARSALPGRRLLADFWLHPTKLPRPEATPKSGA